MRGQQLGELHRARRELGPAYNSRHEQGRHRADLAYLQSRFGAPSRPRTKGTAVTELVYRHELRPVIESGASVMDSVFPLSLEDAGDDDTEDEEGNDDDAA